METENTTAAEPRVDGWSQINTFWYICRATRSSFPQLLTYKLLIGCRLSWFFQPKRLFRTAQKTSEEAKQRRNMTLKWNGVLSIIQCEVCCSTVFVWVEKDRDKTSVVADTSSSLGPKQNLFLQPITMLLSQNGQVTLLIHKKRNVQKKKTLTYHNVFSSNNVEHYWYYNNVKLKMMWNGDKFQSNDSCSLFHF